MSFCSLWCLFLLSLPFTRGGDNDYNVQHRDGSYEFGYDTPDSYHYADANRRNIVRGEFGSRNSGTGNIDSTVYTAGPRGFRPRGKNVARKYDLNQNGPRPIGSIDDPYYDPYEDPSYSFGFRTRTYNRKEEANRIGDVTGRYSYLDDVGERHNVEYIAGKRTGFHVKTPYPDSNPRAYGPLYFRGRGRPIPRGRTSIQKGLDGSYRFVSAGPDQRRTETSDSSGHVRGSYTYLDDKGVQHSVHYIAGPGIGYKVLKNVKGPHLPTIFPFGRPNTIPSDFDDYFPDPDDLFDVKPSGHIKPNMFGGKSKNKDDIPNFDDGVDLNKDDYDKLTKNLGKPTPKPSFDYDGDTDNDFGDLFGGKTKPTSGKGDKSGEHGYKPDLLDPNPRKKPSDDDTSKASEEDDGQYKPGYDSKSEKPVKRPGIKSKPSYDSGQDEDDGQYKPDRKPGRPEKKPKPNYFDQDEDFNLFDDGQKPGKTERPSGYDYPPPTNRGQDRPDCDKCKGTLVTNVGDKVFSVPPGVSVRAHVQAIDLLPVIGKAPSPSEQYNAEISIKEQLNEESDKLVNTSEEDATIVGSLTEKPRV